MFPLFPLFSESPRTKVEAIRRPGSQVPRNARARSSAATGAADMKARLRRAAKQAFRLMGED